MGGWGSLEIDFESSNPRMLFVLTVFASCEVHEKRARFVVLGDLLEMKSYPFMCFF